MRSRKLQHCEAQSSTTGVARWVAESFMLDRKGLADPEGTFSLPIPRAKRFKEYSDMAYLYKKLPRGVPVGNLLSDRVLCDTAAAVVET